MASGIGTVQVKRERGKLVVQGLGKTPRGQNFIKQTVVLSAKNIADPAFKSQMATAVAEMFAQLPLPL